MTVTYTPDAEIIGDDTDSRRLELVTADGTVNGLTSPNVAAQLDLDSSVDAPAGVPLDIPIILDGLLQQFVFWRTTKIGGGLDDPGGTVRARWTLSP